MDVADATEGDEDVGLGCAEIRTDDLPDGHGRQVAQRVVKPAHVQGFHSAEEFLDFDFDGG